jgi:chromosome segregation ATPase
MLLTSLKHDLVQKASEVKMIHVERDEQVKHIAQLDRLVENLQDEEEETTQSRARLLQNLQQVEKEIAAKEAKLETLFPRLATVKEQEAKTKQQYFRSKGYD